MRTVLGNIFLRLQSKKILGRLPRGFDEVPLHRAILMARGNVGYALPIPGTPEYDDAREDKMYQSTASPISEEFGYIKEYESGQGSALLVMPDGPPSPETYAGYDEGPVVSSELRAGLNLLRGKVCYHMQRREVTEATQSIVNVLSQLNKEITRIEPWSPNTSSRDILHLLVWSRETLRICGILLQPFLPIASQSLLDALRLASGARTYNDARIGAGRVRAGPMQRRILFPNAEQRKWEAVEADHQYDVNERMKEVEKTGIKSQYVIFSLT